jgi:hypothetical protein
MGTDWIYSMGSFSGRVGQECRTLHLVGLDEEPGIQSSFQSISYRFIGCMPRTKSIAASEAFQMCPYTQDVPPCSYPLWKTATMQ